MVNVILLLIISACISYLVFVVFDICIGTVIPFLMFFIGSIGISYFTVSIFGMRNVIIFLMIFICISCATFAIFDVVFGDMVFDISHGKESESDNSVSNKTADSLHSEDTTDYSERIM